MQSPANKVLSSVNVNVNVNVKCARPRSLEGVGVGRGSIGDPLPSTHYIQLN